MHTSKSIVSHAEPRAKNFYSTFSDPFIPPEVRHLVFGSTAVFLNITFRKNGIDALIRISPIREIKIGFALINVCLSNVTFRTARMKD